MPSDTPPESLPVLRSRPDWDTYFLDIAHAVAARSSCHRVVELGGVGAVLVETETHHVLGMGYCGAPPGALTCFQAGCLIDPRTGGCTRTVHAEINAVLHSRSSHLPKRLYGTLSPCEWCFKTLVSAGVRAFVFATVYRTVERQRELALAMGVDLVHLPRPWAPPVYVPARYTGPTA